eukprot:CAMPEP_0182542150 /NCGR_PEP_ID=MMETSP1323-20130603/29702_1 /TAXON_ID=236787 /ORGANISM="Florenciella parvula, Strain RCC1693" /LENGTH=58 /DNA_ID=CAMNT_0024752977 /DNA_START=37 /DNA_END=209 /DNA_ORIENTATION=-
MEGHAYALTLRDDYIDACSVRALDLHLHARFTTFWDYHRESRQPVTATITPTIPIRPS